MPNGWGRRMVVLGLGSALALGLAAPRPGRAAPADGPPPAKILWSKVRSFRIPVTVPAKNQDLVRELILHVSDDAGYTWKRGGRTGPDTPEFSFRAPRDGEYWFAVQTRDLDGRLYPSGDRVVEPTLKVIVDATKPTISLEPQGRRGSEAGVRWEVQDDHLSLRTLTLEYQATGALEWRQVPLDSADVKLIGVKTWDAGTADSIRVRLSVRDRANNSHMVEQVLPDGLAEAPGAPDSRVASRPPGVKAIAARPAPAPSADEEDFAPSDPPPAPADEVDDGSTLPPPREAPRRDDREFDPDPPPRRGSTPAPSGPTLLVGSTRFPLKYEVEDAGPDGPALVELWTTRDGGRTWSRQPEDADRVSPYNVDLGGEGTFGLWLVVQSASGLGDPPPAPGDRPHSWVEVDASAPAVSIDRPRVGTGANAGKVVLTWRAGDAHLAERPISLFYRADRPDAPWQPIAEGLGNTGRYVWAAPANVPPKIHLKVEAADTQGNRGAADTLDLGPVVLDRARPKGRIVGLDSGAGTQRQ